MTAEDKRDGFELLSSIPDPDSNEPTCDNFTLSTRKDALVLHLDRDFAVPLVLSLGVAGALIAFVVQAFNHPEAAANLFPLFTSGPAIALVFALIKCKKCEGHHDADKQ